MFRQQAMSDPRLKKEYLTRFLQRLGQKHDIKQESVDFLRLKHHRMYLKALVTPLLHFFIILNRKELFFYLTLDLIPIHHQTAQSRSDA